MYCIVRKRMDWGQPEYSIVHVTSFSFHNHVAFKKSPLVKNRAVVHKWCKESPGTPPPRIKMPRASPHGRKCSLGSWKLRLCLPTQWKRQCHVTNGGLLRARQVYSSGEITSRFLHAHVSLSRFLWPSSHSYLAQFCSIDTWSVTVAH